MGTKKIEGHYLAVGGYESDYLSPLDNYPKPKTVHLTHLVQDAGGVILQEDVFNAFESDETVEDLRKEREALALEQPDLKESLFDPDMIRIEEDSVEARRVLRADSLKELHAFSMGKWKDSNPRQNPPVLRVKLTLEVEVLSDDEAGVVWATHKQNVANHRARVDHQQAQAKVKVRVTTWRDLLIIETVNPEDPSYPGWVPVGPTRGGCTILNTRVSLGVSAEALTWLAKVERTNDDSGDVGWWACDDGTKVFSWWGGVYAVKQLESCTRGNISQIFPDDCVMIPNLQTKDPNETP